MSYMQDFERKLVNVLENAPDRKTIINFVKAKMLESLRNGVVAGKTFRQRKTPVTATAHPQFKRLGERKVVERAVVAVGLEPTTSRM